MDSCVVTTIAGLQELRAEWEALSSLAKNPMLDHHWVLSCAEAFHDERNLRIVVVRERGWLAGVAPLVLEAGGPGRHLVLPGAARLYEPGGWLYSTDAAFGELINAVFQLRTPVLLHRIPQDSLLAHALPALPPRRGAIVVRRAAPTHAIDTSGTWDSYCSSLSRRTARRLSESLATAQSALGPARVDELQPLPDDVDPLLKMLADLELSGWKGRRGTSVAQREDLGKFMQTYCRRAAERHELRVTNLSFGAEVAATEISVDAHGRRWVLKIAYREALAAYFPGLQLAHASIHAAFRCRLTAYEFLGSAEDWQRRWRPETREHQLMLAYPWSFSGLFGACRDASAAFYRRAGRTGSK